MTTKSTAAQVYHAFNDGSVFEADDATLQEYLKTLGTAEEKGQRTDQMLMKQTQIITAWMTSRHIERTQRVIVTAEKRSTAFTWVIVGLTVLNVVVAGWSVYSAEKQTRASIGYMTMLVLDARSQANTLTNIETELRGLRRTTEEVGEHLKTAFPAYKRPLGRGK